MQVPVNTLKLETFFRMASIKDKFKKKKKKS